MTCWYKTWETKVNRRSEATKTGYSCGPWSPQLLRTPTSIPSVLTDALLRQEGYKTSSRRWRSWNRTNRTNRTWANTICRTRRAQPSKQSKWWNSLPKQGPTMQKPLRLSRWLHAWGTSVSFNYLLSTMDHISLTTSKVLQLQNHYKRDCPQVEEVREAGRKTSNTSSKSSNTVRSRSAWRKIAPSEGRQKAKTVTWNRYWWCATSFVYLCRLSLISFVIINGFSEPLNALL